MRKCKRNIIPNSEKSMDFEGWVDLLILVIAFGFLPFPCIRTSKLNMCTKTKIFKYT